MIDYLVWVMDWLSKHEAEPIEHDVEWAHFANVIADCVKDFADFYLQWTSVEERLPPCGEYVYVCSTNYRKNGEWKTRRIKEEESNCWQILDKNGFDVTGFPGIAAFKDKDKLITHWRPKSDLPGTE